MTRRIIIPRRFHRTLGVALAIALWMVPGARADNALPDIGERLRAFTGGPARLVWIRQIADRGNDPFCWGTQLVLMGLDTEDGRGGRALTGTANYHRPLLTPDGRQVVYSRITTREAFVVDWEGGKSRRLGEGYAADVWRDPASGHTWVYLANTGRDGWDRHHADALCRIRLDDPSLREPVWDQAPFTIDNLQLSADGTRFCAQFPHPRAGYADVQGGAWHLLGRGCWTGMSPDHHYRVWIFDGPHRHLTLHDPVNRTSWKLPINTAPGMDGFEVYHPRWSNHSRFFTLTGPYREGRAGENLIAAGGPAVNAWVGRLTEDLRAVEAWLQVTDDTDGHFYPDLWSSLTNSETAIARVPALPDPPEGPSVAADMLAEWTGADGANNRGTRHWEADSIGRAFWGPYSEMEADGGGFRIAPADKGPDPLPPGAFTLEMDIRSAAGHTGVASRTVIAPPAPAPWALEQREGRLWLNPDPDRRPVSESAALDLGPAPVNRSTHLALTGHRRRMTAWRDGRRTGSVRFPEDRPASVPLVLWIGIRGPEADGPSWRGRIGPLALYNRRLSKPEIATRHARMRERAAKRPDPPEYEVTVRLDRALPPPDPDSIRPYRRALLAQVFTVESASAVADVPIGSKMAIAHWTVVDGILQPRRFETGNAYRLRITPFASRPLLESERILLDADDVLLPLYYETAEISGPTGATP